MLSVHSVNGDHVADPAKICVDATEGDCRLIPVGGPHNLNVQRGYGVAFHACSKYPCITPLPVWLAEEVLIVTGLFNRNLAVLPSFAVSALKFDPVAPVVGTRHLKVFLLNLLQKGTRNAAWSER